MDSPPAWLQLLLGVMYVGPLFGGLLFASSGKSQRFLSIATLIPSIAYSFLYMGRGPMLGALFLWVSSYWTRAAFNGQGRVPLFTRRILIWTPIVCVCVIVAGVTIGAARRLSSESILSERIGYYPTALVDADPEAEWYGFRHGVLAHPYAFSIYLQSAVENPPSPKFGAYMFAGPLELLGIRNRQPFENFEVDPGIQSNVYTQFMPPIEDFGLIGSFVSYFAAGSLAGFAFGRVSERHALFSPILTMFYPHVLVIGGFFFAYNSLILAHTYLAMYLYWAHTLEQRHLRAAAFGSAPDSIGARASAKQA